MVCFFISCGPNNIKSIFNMDNTDERNYYSIDLKGKSYKVSFKKDKTYEYTSNQCRELDIGIWKFTDKGEIILFNDDFSGEIKDTVILINRNRISINGLILNGKSQKKGKELDPMFVCEEVIVPKRVIRDGEKINSEIK